MAWKAEQARSMNLKMCVLNNTYGKSYREFKEGGFEDDRALFCRVFEILEEEAEKMKKVNSSFINVAFNRLWDEYEETLESIQNNPVFQTEVVA